MVYIFGMIIPYLLGSIPSAWVLVKLTTGKDLRAIGTGNIGAMNSYDVTGKKWIGIVVFLMDALKGAIAVLLVRIFMHNDVMAVELAAFWVVLGHNLSIFLKGKGGRGLSTTAGAFILINPIVVIIWGIIWSLIMLRIKRNVHIANSVATIITPILLIFITDYFLKIFFFIPNMSRHDLVILTVCVCVVILIRHIKPLKDYFKKGKDNKD
ncbi:MAG: glycerol-3-phosphate acyltransferase [FCB group bacterium]|jgi:glycerol-3-phosphate acyltransferase PlsY